jgi:hypothetical protein
MSAQGHVWTAPSQELSDVDAALVGYGQVSGLLMRRVWPLTSYRRILVTSGVRRQRFEHLA